MKKPTTPSEMGHASWEKRKKGKSKKAISDMMAKVTAAREARRTLVDKTEK